MSPERFAAYCVIAFTLMLATEMAAGLAAAAWAKLVGLARPRRSLLAKGPHPWDSPPRS